MRRAHVVALELIVPVVLIVAWWSASALFPSLYFPPLSGIIDELRKTWLFEHWWSDAMPSLSNFALGYLIACVIGIALGTMLGLLPSVAGALSPVLEFARAVPGVALLPAAILLLGIGSTTRVSLIAFGAIWPVLLNTIDGVRSIEPGIREVARSYRVTPGRRLISIVLPGASPQIVAGMRTGLAIAITVMVFSELLGTTNGLGFQILDAQRSFDVSRMWAGILVLGIIGYLLNLLFRGFEFGVLHWHRRMRSTTRS